LSAPGLVAARVELLG